jgi:putative flippase GtrA
VRSGEKPLRKALGAVRERRSSWIPGAFTTFAKERSPAPGSPRIRPPGAADPIRSPAVAQECIFADVGCTTMTAEVRGSRGSKALLFRYLVIGGGSVVIDVGLLYILHSVVGVQLVLATVIAFLCSLVFNFACNRIMMAGSQGEQLMRHAYRYGLLVVANLGITVAVVTGSAHIGVPYVVGKLGVVAASTCWNFVLYRRWVFTGPAVAPA